MIDLSQQAPIGEGGYRVVYVHPEDPSRCIKVIKDEAVLALKAKAKWYKKLRPLSAFDDNVREVEAYQQSAMLRHDNRVWDHLPRHYGYVETTVGRGLVTDLIRSNGEVAATLESYLKENGLTQELTQAIDELAAWLYETKVLTKNLLPHNILVQQGDALRLYLIDGIGCTTAVNPNWLGAFFVKRYINSRVQKFRARAQWEAEGRKGRWEDVERQHRSWR